MSDIEWLRECLHAAERSRQVMKRALSEIAFFGQSLDEVRKAAAAALVEQQRQYADLTVGESAAEGEGK